MIWGIFTACVKHWNWC